MRALLLALGLVTALAAPAALRAEGRAIIVLDASGSMWGQIAGRTKIDIAREALTGVIGELPADSEMGLMAYGHRVKGACDDIELIVPPGPGTGPAIIAAANNLQFLGKTPLGDAVRKAAETLRSTEEKATVILITDGIETCKADPCALGLELEASGVDFTAHVVGFGLTEDEGRQVACLAENTGGTFVAADDLASLSMALQTTVIVALQEPEPAPEPEPEPAPEPAPAPELTENFDPAMALIAGGPEPDRIGDAVFDVFPLAADGSPGARITTVYGLSKGLLEPGTYRLRATLDAASTEVDFTVEPGKIAAPMAVLEAGILQVRLLDAGSQPIAADASWELKGGEDGAVYGYADRDAVVPAGSYTIEASLGAARISQPVTVIAGEVQPLNLIIATGHVVVNAAYVTGMTVDSGDHFTEILAAKTAIDGSRNALAYGYGPARSFDLSQGDYVAVVTMGAARAEVAFSVKAGATSEVEVVLNAGVAAISAPGASFIEVLAAKADIQGNRASMSYAYEPQHQSTYPAGDYLAVATRGEVKSEIAFTVKPGERTEVTVP